MHLRALGNLLLMGVLAVGLAGCGSRNAGPEVVPVRGMVTLDGAPLPEALVEFVPEHGRPSSAMTAADGSYELVYTESRKGAVVGVPYRVSIRSGRDAISAEGVEVQKAVKEKIPERYNAKTELRAEVAPGENVLNFELQTK